MTSHWIAEVIAGRAEAPPAARLIGFELRSWDEESRAIEVAFTARPEFLNSVGHVQGGLLCAMLDSTLGAACVATLAEDQWAPTTDLHAQFHAPAHPGPLIGTGRVTRRGRGIAFMAGEISDEAGTVVASALATAAIRARGGPG